MRTQSLERLKATQQLAALPPAQAAKYVQSVFKRNNIKCTVKAVDEKQISAEGTAFGERWEFALYLTDKGKVEFDSYSLSTRNMIENVVSSMPNEGEFPQKLKVAGVLKALNKFDKGIEDAVLQMQKFHWWISDFSEALIELAVDVNNKANRK